jgi:ABC-type branched-subunit amino acid transport system substrate-binding protein
MTVRRAPGTRLRALTALVVCVSIVTLAACSSSDKKSSASTTTTSGSSSSGSTKLGVGVTPTAIKLGVALVDFDCVKNFVDEIRVDQDKAYQAYIDDINAKGGIAGRKIEPVYDTYCPLGSAGPLAVCTKLTDDDKVFAVMGTFVDFSGDAQTCVAKQHDTVLITYNLTQAIMDKSPPGLILYAGATNERTVRVLLQLLKRQHTLKGKKVAVLGGSTAAGTVNGTIVPGLKKMGVPLGSTAILSINGTADTAAAQGQLDSFIERWKGEHVTAIFLSGDEVSSKQFVTKIRQEMPNVLLMTDTTDVRNFGEEETLAGVKPNPYEGILAAGGPTPAEYDKSANWAYCAAIYKKYTGKPAPKSTQVVKGPGGKTLDTYGLINDACQSVTMFHDILEKVGQDLNNANWLKTVNGFGAITNRGSGPYSSLHSGKYDIEDNFRLEAFDSSIAPDGDWKAITAVENITGQ